MPARHHLLVRAIPHGDWRHSVYCPVAGCLSQLGAWPPFTGYAYNAAFAPTPWIEYATGPLSAVGTL